MATSVDTSVAENDQSFGQGMRLGLDDGSCGAGIDWSRGIQALKGLSRPTSSPSGDPSGSVLTKVIEGEIIPRLLLAHRDQSIRVRAEEAQSDVGDLADIGTSEAFAELVLVSDTQAIIERVEALQARGITLQQIFLDLLAPVARMLGVFWEEDRCTFADVTIGLSRLHQVLHEIGRRGLGDIDRPKQRRRAYFAPSPGEQHTFGLSMLEEFFLHAGWETACDFVATETAVLKTAASQHLDIIGFSVGCKEFLEPLSDLIRRTRAVSRNRNVTIMVGGRLFLDFPELAAKVVGATVVSDGVHAVQIAESMVSHAPRSGEAQRLM